MYFRRNPKNPLEGKEGKVHLPSSSFTLHPPFFIYLLHPPPSSFTSIPKALTLSTKPSDYSANRITRVDMEAMFLPTLDTNFKIVLTV